MRPAGEVRLALLRAVDALVTPLRAPTLQELAHHAKVGLSAARTTVANMKREEVLEIVREREVDYRNRKVAEYARASKRHEAVDHEPMSRVMGLWVQR